MSFDRRDIRTAMDVYTADNRYLGTVLRITPGPTHVEHAAPPAPLQASKVSGEQLGPMPTSALGNHAPQVQGAGMQYGTMPDAPPLGDGAIVVGRWWGLRGRRTVPLADVQTVSLERIVIRA